MAHPKRRTSKARAGRRRTHQKLTAPTLVKCKQCERLKPAHMICPFCGYYAARAVVEIKVKEKKQKKR